MPVQIESSWSTVLRDEFASPYFHELVAFLKKEKADGHAIFPPGNLIFNAFAHTPYDDVRVVILGQDPYHGDDQAHGLSFSVQDGVPLPPSLKNIFKEIHPDESLAQIRQRSGNLTHWADQGVLLLNAILTVRAHEAASHRKKGWEIFTDAVISALSAKSDQVIFLLWGNYAKSKKSLIDTSVHTVLESVHPSPLSASRGWFGCGHFDKVNEILEKSGGQKIVW